MKNYDELTAIFDSAINKNAVAAQNLSLYLAQHPETSGNEKNSSEQHIKFLTDLGLNVTRNFCDVPYSYFANVVKKDNAKYKMVIIAEYDALPEIGHACGHCASGAISLLTAATFKEIADQIDVDIDIIGTPDEEFDGYKIPMIQKGAFEKYDFAMMIHMGSGTSTANYKIVSLSAFRVKFKGVSSHAAAAPFNGKNALDAATILMTSCGLLRQQLKPGAIMSYYVVNGGVVSNSIPDYTELEFCIRHDKIAYLQEMKTKLTNCIAGAALATGTEYEMNYIGYEYSDMPFFKTGTDIVCDVFNELGLKNEPTMPITISTDMGNVGYACPSMHPILAVCDEYYPLHTVEMAAEMQKPTINKTINNGAKVFGHTFIKFIADKSNFESIRNDFNKAIKENH
ncbi:M20/M25/M40 family metallo-hydrolase [Orbus wheelerorum]|uniref:M20/M25/M40 family metallo-hydrolase n=1 Tax=Orbus wheelerorum TaxID=3074111 RepID=UPI00370D80A2